MNILDENILKSQRQTLQSWRISIRQIGYDVGRKGMKDDEIIPFLHSLRRPTFFTRDLGFYDRSLCHAQYCLVCMAVGKYEAATFVRRLLRHPEFNLSEANGHSDSRFTGRASSVATLRGTGDYSVME